MKLAVQLYTLRDDYKTPEEFLEILEKVKALGFEGVEFAGYGGVEPERLRAKLDELGLTAVGTHGSIDDYRDDKIDESIALAKTLGMQYMGVGGAPHSTKEEVEELKSIYAKANQKGKECGIQFYYHNHTEEFKNRFDGKLCMDCIAEEAYLELDTYWSFFAGVDNYRYITENADNIILLHIKDGLNGKPTALGEGNNDLLGVFKAAKEAGIEWLILENDNPEPNGISDITRSMEYFKKNL